MSSRKATGDFGEDLAARWLEKRGWRILARQFRIRGGELDLIAERKEELAFVEVKTRRSRLGGWPEEAVTAGKQEKLWRAAESWLAREEEAGRDFSKRRPLLAIVAILLRGEEAELRWIELEGS